MLHMVLFKLEMVQVNKKLSYTQKQIIIPLFNILKVQKVKFNLRYLNSGKTHKKLVHTSKKFNQDKGIWIPKISL